MRIDLNGPAAAPEAFGQVTKPGNNNSSLQVSESKVEATIDTTSLSTSSAVKTLTSKAVEVFPTRAEKVAALQQAVNSGQYKVDSDKTALALSQADV